MLAGLGRWLRAAGYDTEIVENSLDDQKILQHSLKENRMLLTRDRHFLTMDIPEKTMLFLKGNTLEECVKELNQALKLNWVFAPFSRCLLCNSLLVEPEDQRILEQVPDEIRFNTGTYWFCEQCKKVYWQGSHTEQMLKQLQTWQNSP